MCLSLKSCSQVFLTRTFSGRLHVLLLRASGAAGHKLHLLCTVWNEDSIQTGEAWFKCSPDIKAPTQSKIFLPSQGVKLLLLPPILCVSLKRFRNGRSGTQKLDCQVTFPENLDFSGICQEAFTSGFAQVRVFPLSYLHIVSLVIYKFICSSRMTTSTLCTRWWCTLVTRRVDTTLPTFVTGQTRAGTTQMTATSDRYVQSDNICLRSCLESFFFLPQNHERYYNNAQKVPYVQIQLSWIHTPNK